MLGGVRNMSVCLGRACALVGEEKTSLKALKAAEDLLQQEEEQELLEEGRREDEENDDDDDDDEKKTVVLGGKRAWKKSGSGGGSGEGDGIEGDGSGGDAREQSLAVYKEHVKAELAAEIALVRKFLTTMALRKQQQQQQQKKKNGVLIKENACLKLTLAHLRRVFFFDFEAFAPSLSSSGDQVQQRLQRIANLSGKLFAALLTKFGLLSALQKQQQLQHIASGGDKSDTSSNGDDNKKNTKKKNKQQKNEGDSSLLSSGLVHYDPYTGETSPLPAKITVAQAKQARGGELKKKKKKVKELLFPASSTAGVGDQVLEVAANLVPLLESFRRDYGMCFDASGRFNFDELFSAAADSDGDGDNAEVPKEKSNLEAKEKKEQNDDDAMVVDVPSSSADASGGGGVHLEICSGAGEWVVQQAKHCTSSGSSSNNASRWLSLELRHDRVYKTFSRSVLEFCPNLVVLGGDASVVVPHHIPKASLSGVYVNYPEPPQQSGEEGGESQGKHLLTADFLAAILIALKDGGLFTLLTDNVWYGKLLLRTLAGLSVSHPHLEASFCNALPASSASSEGGEEKTEVELQLSGLTLYKGKPGPASGHLVQASSYFDRLWRRGRQPDRYFISLRRSTQGSSAGNGEVGGAGLVVKTQENRHKRAAGVIMASAVRGKKMKFDD